MIGVDIITIIKFYMSPVDYLLTLVHTWFEYMRQVDSKWYSKCELASTLPFGVYLSRVLNHMH